MEQHPSPGKMYRGENFLADVLCTMSRRPGGLVGEVSIVTGDQDLKPNEELVVHLPDGRKAFCTPSRALAPGAWIVQISRIDEEVCERRSPVTPLYQVVLPCRSLCRPKDHIRFGCAPADTIH